MANPLQAVNEAAGAEFQPYGEGLQIVQTFGLPQAEYAAIHKSCAVMDCPQRAFIELTGKDRHAFLNNLLTNQTFDKQTKQGMAAHTGVYAFLLNTKGRIVTDLVVLELGERLLMELDARLIATVEPLLNKYLFADQVKIGSLVGKSHLISLHGPGAGERVSGMGLTYLESKTHQIAGVSVVVYRDDVCGVPGFHVIAPVEGAAAVWGELAAGAKPTGWAAFNSTRIEAGRPIFGIDFDETILPAETSVFNRAVSLTKGCYLGQEIVARMYARNQVPKLLVGYRMMADALPVAGSPIFDGESNQVGVVTSSTVSPILSNAAIGLGYVRKPLFAVGTKLRIPAEGALQDAEVVETPFVR